MVSQALASTLDMSCVQAKVKAPEIRHGIVQKYERRRKGERVFLAALYACNDNYDFEDPDMTTLYCSNRAWVGDLPTCIALSEYEEEEDAGYEYEEGDEEDDEDAAEAEEEEQRQYNYVPPPPPPATPTEPPQVHTENVEDVNNEVQPVESQSREHEQVEQHHAEDDNHTQVEELEATNTHTDSNVDVTESTQDPYEPRVLDENCGSDNGGCDQKCQRVLFPGENEPRIQCACAEGFSLDPYDYSTCHDINECELPEVVEECSHGCVNTEGSYHCVAPVVLEEKEEEEQEVASKTDDVEEPPKHELTSEAPVVQCESGFRLHNGQCVDIDECAEGTSGCQMCINTEGSYECTCPSGYDLAEDEKTCVDIDECAIVSEDEEYSAAYKVCSHGCHNTEGSFECLCPPLYHLSEDGRTCAVDSCADLENPALNKTRCSYECTDLATGGFQCHCPQGYALADTYNCVESQTACERNGDVCAPGSCQEAENEFGFQCICPVGYREENYRCVDINECEDGTHECSHQCVNTEGNYLCQCPQGYVLPYVTARSCEDVNECEHQPEICGVLKCSNFPGSFTCLCEDGSEPNAEGICPSMVANVDPCAENRCSHQCLPEGESYRCDCPTGWSLDETQLNCVQAAVCDSNKNGCDHICNEDGSCSCRDGFSLDANGKTCQDIDECQVNNGGCHQLCINVEGGFSCACHEGFEFLDGPLRDYCFDIDECALGTHNCAKDMTCENLNGSFTCLCPKGYALGLPISHPLTSNEVIENSLDHHLHLVYNTSSTYTSSPSDSLTSQSCLDIDECSIANGGCSHFCMNLPGDYECSCPPGHLLSSADNKTCVLVNLCFRENGGCSHACSTHNGQVECSCPEGYHLDSNGRTCVDNDECFISNGGCEQICENSIGSYSCSCREGFILSSNGHACLDIDECIDGVANCSFICINLLGSFACSCEAGFQLADDQRTCLDIDECALGKHDCSHDCVNVDGGYKCSCPQGYYLGEHQSVCVDMNECNAEDHGCSHDCYNTMGSYLCACPDGFILSGDEKTCINSMCFENNGGCSHLCDPDLGCSCPPGMILGLDGKTCEDVDECSADNGGCAFKCVNLPGSYECVCPDGSKPENPFDPCPITCPAGFTFSRDDPNKCEDIDECSLPGVCQYQCRNTNGSYECLCPKGYRLENGRDCQDIDECADNNGGCVGGECINHNGGHECRCPLGQRLAADRKTCEVVQELRDQCHPLAAPANGAIHCTKYRHKKKRFYNTRCKVWCNPGFELQGPTHRYCNATGQWDHHESVCLPKTCPAFASPLSGVITPLSCLFGQIRVGEECHLKCNPGYVPVGASVAVCTSQLQWSYNGTFDCLPMQTEPRLGVSNGFTPLSLPNAPPTFTAGTTTLHNTQSSFNGRPLPDFGFSMTSFGGGGNGVTGVGATAGHRPFIKCPRNTTVFLTGLERTAHVILQKPITNLDYRYIESSPAWTKDLQGNLEAGTHVVIFRGHDPISGKKARCKTVIHVKHAEGPVVEYCTPSFEVSLGENQVFRSVVWEEPIFSSKYGPIKKVYKSRIPGELFGLGVHSVYYEATNADGLTAKCEFKIRVNAAGVSSSQDHLASNSIEYGGGHMNKVHKLPKYPSVPRPSPIFTPPQLPAAPTSIHPHPPSIHHHSPSSAVPHPNMIKAPLLPGHESFIICPGRDPIKVTSSQAVELPPNCILKNIRINPFRQFMSQRVMPRLWSSYRLF
ncbi:uncharacterized protein isoform X2 [Musca autumnalis]